MLPRAITLRHYSIAVIGMILQFIDAAIIVPLYCAYQLHTRHSAKYEVETSVPRMQDLYAAPYSISIGMVLPAVCMAIPFSTQIQHSWIGSGNFFHFL